MKRSIIGIVFDSDGKKILVLKRRDVPIWVLPGGGVEISESPEEAVIREVYEETGLHVSIKRLVGFYTPINRLALPTYVFECTPISGSLTTGDETQHLGFYDEDHMPSPLFFIHHEWIKDAKKQLPNPINKPLDQVTYWNLFKYFCRHPIHVMRFILSLAGIPVNS